MINVWKDNDTGRVSKKLDIGLGVRDTCTMTLHVYTEWRDTYRRYYFRLSYAGYWLTLASRRFETQEEAKSAAEIAAARLMRIFQECSELKWMGA